jgi:hypothetical protein
MNIGCNQVITTVSTSLACSIRQCTCKGEASCIASSKHQYSTHETLRSIRAADPVFVSTLHPIGRGAFAYGPVCVSIQDTIQLVGVLNNANEVNLNNQRQLVTCVTEGFMEISATHERTGAKRSVLCPGDYITLTHSPEGVTYIGKWKQKPKSSPFDIGAAAAAAAADGEDGGNVDDATRYMHGFEDSRDYGVVIQQLMNVVNSSIDVHGQLIACDHVHKKYYVRLYGSKLIWFKR